MDAVRSILFVGRTMQATNRLYYDVLPLVADDQRIQTYFTFDESSEFGDGVPRFLDRQQVKLIPWEVAVDPERFTCDVTVSASANTNLRHLPGRKLVMAHGAGSHKYRARPGGDEPAVSSLSPLQLRHDGELIPSVVALSGLDASRRLSHSCPEAVGHAEVHGDVCAERLHLSLPHRDRYRRALGVPRWQRLVVVSSTWGADSLLRQTPWLFDRLLAELPADEYRVAFILHPNSWDRHGRPTIRGWLADARRRGLAIIPPEEGWRAAIVASDLVVADHGSVGFYAADLGRPLTYATFSDTEIPEDAPPVALRRVAPHLDPASPLAPQLEAAINGHDPHKYRPITRLALDPEGSPGERTRASLYRLLDLEPDSPAPDIEPVPLPEADWRPPTASHVHPAPGTSPLRLLRFPAAAKNPAVHPERVLVVDAAEAAERIRYAAAVLVATEFDLTTAEAAAEAANLLDGHRGAKIAVVSLAGGDWLLYRRDGLIGRASGDSSPEPATLGAAVYLSARTGPWPRRLRYREGRRDLTVPVTPVER